MATAESPNPKQLFGEQLRAARLAIGISQEELGHRAGLDRTYISSCERGKRNISLEAIVRLSKALNLSPSQLLNGLEEKKGI